MDGRPEPEGQPRLQGGWGRLGEMYQESLQWEAADCITATQARIEGI